VLCDCLHRPLDGLQVGVVHGRQEVLRDPAQMRSRGTAESIEPVRSQDRFRTTGVARAGRSLDEPIEHQAIDEPGDAALAQDHAVGELAHADPTIGRVGDGQQGVVFGQGQVVFRAQLLVEATCDAGVRGQERAPRLEAWVARGQGSRVGAFGDGHGDRPDGTRRSRSSPVVAGATMLAHTASRHHPDVLDRGVAAPDVIVIGGGIIGVAAADQLAALGRRVVLVEQGDIAAGASGRNSGVVQHPFDPVLSELHLETLALYRELDGIELPGKPAGLLYVTHDVDGARRLATAIGATNPHLDPTFVSPEEVRRLEPSIAEGVAACHLDIGYPVGPATATRAYAARAIRHGVDVRTGIAATPWIEGGRALGVTLANGGRVAAWDVLVAAGPWTPALLDPSGARMPIVPRWGVVVPVALADPPRRVLEEAEISIEPGSADDGEAGHAFSLVTAEGSSSLGSTFLPDEPDAAALVPILIRRGARFVPAIADAAFGTPRACARPQSLDGRPLVGRVPGVDGLWVAAGHGPWGISTGPASARLIADLIDGRRAAPPVALDPARFGSPVA
jgi:D-hydroxyproline dehydrogenase subunit beta